MSEELKRPIREKHKPYQGYEIFERYSKAQDKYIDQLESKLKAVEGRKDCDCCGEENTHDLRVCNKCRNKWSINELKKNH